MGYIRRMKRSGWAALLLTAAGIMGQPAWGADNLVWKEEVFTKTTYEEDIRVTLQDIIGRNGQQVIFRPNVKGLVTAQFEGSPLQGVFERLIEENALDYEYNAASNTVVIFPKGKPQSSAQMRIISPQYASFDEILQTLDKFGVVDKDVKIITDEVTGSMMVKGPPEKLNDIELIAAQVDEAFKNRATSQVQKRKDAFETQTLESAMKPPVLKVIPLRYASVDTATTSFQGQSVSVPGIIESLKAFVGDVQVQGEKDSKTVSSASRPIISVDKRTNAVIVQGTQQQVEEIEKVIAKLDQPVPLVEIEVLIVNAEAGVSKQLGMRWGGANSFGDNRSAVGIPSQTTTAGGSQMPITGTSEKAQVGAWGVDSIPGALSASFLYQGTRAGLMAKLDALSSKNLTQTIASPKVVTLNNLAAKITNATNFNFVVTANDNNASSTLNTVSTGMTLNITPSVIPAEVPGSKRLVRLNINAKYSTPSGGTGTTVQTDDQEVQTNVIIPEQATFILGGLFDINRTENQAGIPGFSDIPLFGHLFKTSSSGDTKNETLFLISPSIYESEQIAGRDGGRIREYVKEEKFIMRQERENLYRNSHLLNTGYNLDEDE